MEERQNSLKHSIELDHCYTNRRSPAQPKPTDPLPIANSPEGSGIKHVTQTTSSSATLTPSPSPATIASAANLKAVPIKIEIKIKFNVKLSILENS